MRWLLVGMIALNLLQALYIVNTGFNQTDTPPSYLASDQAQTLQGALILEATASHSDHTTVHPGIAQLSTKVLQVSRSLLDNYIQSSEAQNSVRFSLWPGGGFLASYVRPNSLAARLGLIKGDVIKSINNTQLNSLLHALSVYQDLDELQFLELQIQRQGKIFSYFYKLID
ncbi:MAG: PDZ domain-containing protein [Bermanella sp.]